MSIILLVITGLICGLMAAVVKKHTSPANQLSAYLYKTKSYLRLDLTMGVLGAFIGRFLAALISNMGMDMSLVGFVFVLGGAIIFIWMGRVIPWLDIL